MLDTWFVNTGTRMNPNLQFSAITPGANNGSSGGIILTSFRWNSQLTDCAALLEGSAAWTETLDTGFRAWMAAYLDWLLTSPHGQGEAHATNNHGTWLAVNRMAMALYLRNQTLADMLAAQLETASPSALSRQILPSGQMPHETARADSVNYCTMNMRALVTLAQVRLYSF